MSKFLMIGSDIEFFVEDNKGVMGSAIGMLHGSKDEPRLVSCGNLQEDNVLAEMAIDPCTTEGEWQTKLASVKNKLSSVVKEFDHKLITKSSHHFTQAQLMGWGGMAMEMGCMPDFDVYSQSSNPKPSARTTLRTAAGHIHFSYLNPTLEATTSIVKCLDATLGMWSVLTDSDVFRRSLYGKAGCCRIKEYGGEYRTLGNFWTENFARQRYVFQVTKLCVEQHETLLPRLNAIISQKRVVEIINNSDYEAAKLVSTRMHDVITKAIADGEGVKSNAA